VTVNERGTEGGGEKGQPGDLSDEKDQRLTNSIDSEETLLVYNYFFSVLYWVSNNLHNISRGTTVG